MTEAKVQTKIIKWLEKEGYYVIKTIVSNKKGVPDIIACSPTGQFIAIEVKFGTNTATKLQQYNLDLIKSKGGKAMVAWSLEEVQDVLQQP